MRTPYDFSTVTKTSPARLARRNHEHVVGSCSQQGVGSDREARGEDLGGWVRRGVEGGARGIGDLRTMLYYCSITNSIMAPVERVEESLKQSWTLQWTNI